MNNVTLIGRLTADPVLRYTQSNMAVASFTLAVDRQVKKDEEKDADFIRINVFGRQAENCDRYLAKGYRACIEGRIHTGSYKNKNGDTVYTTDVVANHVEFLDWKVVDPVPGGQDYRTAGRHRQQERQTTMYDIPDDFAEVEGDTPF